MNVVFSCLCLSLKNINSAILNLFKIIHSNCKSSITFCLASFYVSFAFNSMVHKWLQTLISHGTSVGRKEYNPHLGWESKAQTREPLCCSHLYLHNRTAWVVIRWYIIFTQRDYITTTSAATRCVGKVKDHRISAQTFTNVIYLGCSWLYV